MKQQKILIVDDNQGILDMLGLFLKLACPEYQVVLANNGPLALDQLKQQNIPPIDIVLTGYGMPVMDGLSLARAVRQHWPELPIILMTTHPPGYDLSQKIKALNLNGFIQKPFHLRQLVELLQNNAASSL